MSDTMEEGNIIEWMKKEGDAVEAGDTLAEVETDKATMELDSFVDGVLLHIAVKEGPVAIDGVIAIIGDKDEDWQTALAEAEANNGNGAAKPVAEESQPEEESSAETAPETSASPEDARIKSSPLARKMAQDAGIDLAAIRGSGDFGRIVKKDVEAAIEEQKAAPAPIKQPATQPATPAAPAPTPAAPPAPAPVEAEAPAVTPFFYGAGEANYEDKNLSQMRKVIARRLSESKFTAPHFYLTIEIDMSKAIQMRKRLNEVAPVKISFNDLVLKACAASLRQHPAVNSSWLGDKLRINHDVNIGVAVAIDEGLLVPVVRYADMKTLSQINTEVKTLAAKAQKRKLQPEEMQGNTFTVSNLGMFGIEEFTAIINPPDACILAVGTIVQKPVVKNGEIVVGNIMKVTLSCDHRVVDGAKGAQFLKTLREMLEDPLRLMV